MNSKKALVVAHLSTVVKFNSKGLKKRKKRVAHRDRNSLNPHVTYRFFSERVAVTIAWNGFLDLLEDYPEIEVVLRCFSMCRSNDHNQSADNDLHSRAFTLTPP